MNRTDDPEFLRANLYTQLLVEGDYHLDLSHYARPFAPGLVQLLIIDTPTTTAYVTDAELANYPFSEDEAFRIGQANTDAQGYGQINDLGAAGIHQALGGDSVVTAAKLGNPRELCSDADISADKGIVFLPLHRSNIFFAPMGATGDQLDHLRGIAKMGWEQVKDVKGALTDELYYWATDGTITRLSDGAKTAPPTSAAATSAAKEEPESAPINTSSTSSNSVPEFRLSVVFNQDISGAVRDIEFDPLRVAGNGIGFEIVFGKYQSKAEGQNRFTTICTLPKPRGAWRADADGDIRWFEDEYQIKATVADLAKAVNADDFAFDQIGFCDYQELGLEIVKCEWLWFGKDYVGHKLEFENVNDNWNQDLTVVGPADAVNTSAGSDNGLTEVEDIDLNIKMVTGLVYPGTLKTYTNANGTPTTIATSAQTIGLGGVPGDTPVSQIAEFLAGTPHQEVDPDGNYTLQVVSEDDEYTVLPPDTPVSDSRVTGAKIVALCEIGTVAPPAVGDLDLLLSVVPHPPIPVGAQDVALTLPSDTTVAELAQALLRMPQFGKGKDPNLTWALQVAPPPGNEGWQNLEPDEVIGECHGWLTFPHMLVALRRADGEDDEMDIAGLMAAMGISLTDSDDDEDDDDQGGDYAAANCDAAAPETFNLVLNVAEGLDYMKGQPTIHKFELEDVPADTTIGNLAAFLASIPDLKVAPDDNYTICVLDPDMGGSVIWAGLDENSTLNPTKVDWMQRAKAIGLAVVEPAEVVLNHKFEQKPAASPSPTPKASQAPKATKTPAPTNVPAASAANASAPRTSAKASSDEFPDPIKAKFKRLRDALVTALGSNRWLVAPGKSKITCGQCSFKLGGNTGIGMVVERKGYALYFAGSFNKSTKSIGFPSEMLLVHPHNVKKSALRNVVAVQKKYAGMFTWDSETPASWATKPWKQAQIDQFATELTVALDADLKTLPKA